MLYNLKVKAGEASIGKSNNAAKSDASTTKKPKVCLMLIYFLDEPPT